MGAEQGLGCDEGAACRTPARAAGGAKLGSPAPQAGEPRLGPAVWQGGGGVPGTAQPGRPPALAPGCGWHLGPPSRSPWPALRPALWRAGPGSAGSWAPGLGGHTAGGPAGQGAVRPGASPALPRGVAALRPGGGGGGAGLTEPGLRGWRSARASRPGRCFVLGKARPLPRQPRRGRSESRLASCRGSWGRRPGSFLPSAS